MSGITEDVVTGIIAKDCDVDKEKVKILDLKKSPGSAQGDGFACVILKLDVKASVDGRDATEFNYIAKVCPEDDIRTEFIKKVCVQ